METKKRSKIRTTGELIREIAFPCQAAIGSPSWQSIPPKILVCNPERVYECRRAKSAVEVMRDTKI